MPDNVNLRYFPAAPVRMQQAGEIVPTVIRVHSPLIDPSKKVVPNIVYDNDNYQIRPSDYNDVLNLNSTVDVVAIPVFNRENPNVLSLIMVEMRILDAEGATTPGSTC